MRQLIVTSFFKFAHEGIRVQEFEPNDEPQDMPDECADIALAEGWADVPKADRLAAEQAEAERLAAERAEADRLAAEQAEAERLAAETGAAEKLSRGESPENKDAAKQRKTKSAE